MFIIDVTPIIVIALIALYYVLKFFWILITTAWEAIVTDLRGDKKD